MFDSFLERMVQGSKCAVFDGGGKTGWFDIKSCSTRVGNARVSLLACHRLGDEEDA